MKSCKKLLWAIGLLLGAFVLNPNVAFAAEKGAEQNIGSTLPLAFCIPFAGLRYVLLYARWLLKDGGIKTSSMLLFCGHLPL